LQKFPGGSCLQWTTGEGVTLTAPPIGPEHVLERNPLQPETHKQEETSTRRASLRNIV
jgi:hypothetical protein